MPTRYPGAVGAGVREGISPLTPPPGTRRIERNVQAGGPEPEERQVCTELRSDNKPCRAWALPGKETCLSHGPKYES